MLLVMVFVIGLLVVFVGGYQFAEKKALAPKKKYDEIMEPASGHDYACEALVTRVFEQRLVEAGIMNTEEMTTCDSPACKDCLPTHQAKTRRLQQEHKEAEAKKKLRLPAPGAKRKTLKITEGGRHNREIPWPESVPEYASIKVEDNDPWTKRIVFVWTDPDTARTLSKTMLIPVLTGLDADFTDGSKPVVWIPPTHPGSDPVHRPMAGKSRAEAIAELRKNPPRPPKGKGGGSPMTPERRARAIKSLTERR